MSIALKTVDSRDKFYTVTALRKITKALKKTRPGAVISSVLLALVMGGVWGCATPPEVYTRNPAELYNAGLQAYLGGRFEEAGSTFRKLLDDHPMSAYSVDAELLLGDVSYAMESYEDAGAYYANFIALRPAHPKAPYALFQKGMSHMKEVLALDRDQTSTRKALFAFEDLLTAYPGSPYAERSGELIAFLRGRLAEREFYIANYYFKRKNYKGSLGRLRDILAEYPDAGLTDRALYYIGESYSRLGEKELAEDAFSTLLKNYPESPYAEDARDRMRAG